MKTLEKAYSDLWHLVDKEEIYLKTVDFDLVCKMINAPRKEMDDLLIEELGYSGEELLKTFREKAV